MSAVTEIPIDRPVVDHPVGRRRWSAGRIARVGVMVIVAAMFVIPIVGFIAMAFRSQAGVAADSDGWLGLQGMSWDNVVYSWSQITGFGPGEGGHGNGFGCDGSRTWKRLSSRLGIPID